MGELNSELAAEAEELLREGFVEGITIQIRSEFSNNSSEASWAVGHGIEKFITRKAMPDNPCAYIATCARREMVRIARKQARYDSIDALSRDNDEPFQPPDTGWSVEERALFDEVFRQARSVVLAWETGNVRETTLLYIEAAQEGEPLTSEQAAELLSGFLGQSFDPASVRIWKSRGFRRLRQHFDASEQSGDEPE